MTLIKFSFLVFALIFLGACDPEVKKSPEQMREEARESIVLERTKLMNASGVMDTNRANSMVDMYITFVQNNPNDKDASEFMFQAASLCMGKQDYKRAIRLFENITTNYKDEKRAPESYFLIAHIYENYLNQRGAAEDAYKLIIEKFPRHDLSLQARAALKNMNSGMTDLELVKKFEEQNAGK